MTGYQCPDCGKWVVTEDPEPPGIIHICDDCSQKMERDQDE